MKAAPPQSAPHHPQGCKLSAEQKWTTQLALWPAHYKRNCHHPLLKHIFRCQLKAVKCTAPPLTASLASCAAPLTAFLASCSESEQPNMNSQHTHWGERRKHTSREHDCPCRHLPPEFEDPQEAHSQASFSFKSWWGQAGWERQGGLSRDLEARLLGTHNTVEGGR